MDAQVVSVYRSQNSRCVILLNEADKNVRFIGLEESNGELRIDVDRMDARRFHDEFRQIPEYPVLRAVEHFEHPLTPAIVVTSTAAKILSQLKTNKGIIMQDNDRLTLAERNVLATHKASIPKTGPCPSVRPCTTTEVIPGSSAKQKKGTWDAKETATESNIDATRRALKNHKAAKAKAERLATRKAKGKGKKMTEQQNQEGTTQDASTAQQKPAEKPAAKKAAKAAPKKPAAKEAPSKSTKKSTTKETKTVNEKIAGKATKTTAKKTTKAEPKAAKKAPAKKATGKAAPAKATKLAKGTGKKAAVTKSAPAKASGKAKQKPDGARRGRKGSFDESQKITLLTKDNPKREGTSAYDTFETLRKSKTVGDFFSKGGSSASLHWNIERGYIKVS